MLKARLFFRFLNPCVVLLDIITAEFFIFAGLFAEYIFFYGSPAGNDRNPAVKILLIQIGGVLVDRHILPPSIDQEDRQCEKRNRNNLMTCEKAESEKSRYNGGNEQVVFIIFCAIGIGNRTRSEYVHYRGRVLRLCSRSL